MIYLLKIFKKWLDGFRRRKVVKSISEKAYIRSIKTRSLKWWNRVTQTQLYYQELIDKFTKERMEKNKQVVFTQFKLLLQSDRWKRRIKRIIKIQSVVRRYLSMKKYKILKLKYIYIQEIATKRETYVEHLNVEQLIKYLKENEWVYVLFWADWLNLSKTIKYRTNFARAAYELVGRRHLKCKFVIADSNSTVSIMYYIIIIN